MKTHLILAFAVASCLSLPAHADTAMVYELTDAGGAKTQQTYTIRERFLRVDRNPDAAGNYLILDAGFMFMNIVDSKQETFTTFGESPFHQGEQMPARPGDGSASVPEAAASVQAAAPSPAGADLRYTGQSDSVAGIPCRVFTEMRKDKAVAEHCLADASSLGMTTRELITVARLIEFSKQRTDPDWIAAQSDEKFITIRSRPAPDRAATFELKSVSHAIIPQFYFRIPPAYQKLEPKDDYSGLITGTK